MRYFQCNAHFLILENKKSSYLTMNIDILILKTLCVQNAAPWVSFLKKKIKNCEMYFVSFAVSISTE